MTLLLTSYPLVYAFPMEDVSASQLNLGKFAIHADYAAYSFPRARTHYVYFSPLVNSL